MLEDSGSLNVPEGAAPPPAAAPSAAPTDSSIGSPSDKLIAGRPAEPVALDPEAAKQALRTAQVDALKALRGEGETAEQKAARDKLGRFAPKDGEAAPEPDAADAEPEDTNDADFGDAPEHLPEEIKAVWSKAPPIMRDYLAWSEDQMHRARSQIGRDRAFHQVAQQYRHELDARGLAPAEAFGQLMEWRQALTDDPEGTLLELIETNKQGVNPQELAYRALETLGVDPLDLIDPAAAPRPESREIAEMWRDLAQLRRTASTYETHYTQAEQQERAYYEQQQQQQEQQAARDNVVARFMQEFPDVAGMDDAMSKHITALQRGNPGLSLDALLTRAYYAAKADAQKSALTKAQSREDEYSEAARKAASQNVRGTPVASSNQPTSVRAAQQAALAQARARASAGSSF